MDYHWLDQDDYDKAVGQLRLQIGAALQPLCSYGQDVYVKGAIIEIVKLAEAFGMRVRGIDKPISLDYIRRKR